MATWLSNGELRFEPSPSLRAPAPITVQTGYLCTVDTGPRMCLFCLVEYRLGEESIPRWVRKRISSILEFWKLVWLVFLINITLVFKLVLTRSHLQSLREFKIFQPILYSLNLIVHHDPLPLIFLYLYSNLFLAQIRPLKKNLYFQNAFWISNKVIE